MQHQVKLYMANNCINSHGNQGTLDAAAKGALEAEFGSSKDEDVIIKILEKGNIIESEVRLGLLAHLHLRLNEHRLTHMSQNSGRDGVKNVSAGGTVAH